VESDADAMWAALTAHDEVFRKTVKAGGGHLFKHTGDGACAGIGSRRGQPS
jgi:hypothetical protein